MTIPLSQNETWISNHSGSLFSKVIRARFLFGVGIAGPKKQHLSLWTYHILELFRNRSPACFATLPSGSNLRRLGQCSVAALHKRNKNRADGPFLNSAIIIGIVLGSGLSPIFGIDDIKKINSMDIENLRADRSRLIKMEGHGSVIEHLPKVNSPFYTRPPQIRLREKEYAEPWRQVRRQTLQTPVPGGAIAVPKTEQDDNDHPATRKKTLLFEDVFEKTLPKI
jgi:hypothetical protein